MAYQGYPYELAYQPNDCRSDLQGIYCYIRKPGGIIVGPFPMVQGPRFFKGLYFYVYQVLPNDPIGKYFVSMFSPQEKGPTPFGMHEFYSFWVDPPPAGPLLGIIETQNRHEGVVLPDPVLTARIADPTLSGTILPDRNAAEMSGGDFSGEVKDNNLSGESDDLQLP